MCSGRSIPSRYEVVPIGITRAGAWLLCPCRVTPFPPRVPERGAQVALVPGGAGRLLVLPEEGGPAELSLAVDVVFPVLHGPFGEDGTVQGAAELAGVPYVGSGVLGSAAAMDKDAAKRLMRERGLPIPRFQSFTFGETPSFEAVTAELGRPVFVKPARLGSSVGVGKAATEEEFAAAVAEAFRHDRKILVEEFVRGREIECGVLEGEDGSLLVSLPGEIVPTNRHAFYSYEAKYLDEEGAEIKVPAELPTSHSPGRARAFGRGLPGALLRGHGAHRFLPARGWRALAQRGEHPAGLHQDQHVSQGARGKRGELLRACRPSHPPRARPCPSARDAFGVRLRRERAYHREHVRGALDKRAWRCDASA